MTVALMGAGHMGSGLGAALREGGHDVITCLQGRSPRTVALATEAGLRPVPTLADLVTTADVVLVVTPPDAATAAAEQLADAARHSGGRPLVADLNATAPSTVEEIERILAAAGLDLVDGAISGPPPTVRPGARIFLSGPRASEIAELAWVGIEPVPVGDRAGTASAVKMCTASVYKGVTGILTQAIRTAAHHGVVEHVLTDLTKSGFEPTEQIAMAATKAWRYVPEMREIARTQAGAGLPEALFAAMATVYEQLAETELARGRPETVDRGMTPTEMVTLLRRPNS
jgi:3-hydroxyisobutyrate dehydrogenase-like beta-hydroxyacid dehydrogenase